MHYGTGNATAQALDIKKSLRGTGQYTSIVKCLNGECPQDKRREYQSDEPSGVNDLFPIHGHKIRRATESISSSSNLVLNQRVD